MSFFRKNFQLVAGVCTLICISFCSSIDLSAQRFACDGQLLVSLNDGVSTKLARPVYIPFSPPFLSPFINYFEGSFDALGFNSEDNYIYGVQKNTNAIVRLKRDNTYDTIGIVTIVDTLKAEAGDCTVDGHFLVYEHSLNQILVFDVVDNFELVQRVDLKWASDAPNSGPFKTRIFDFAIDPNNPYKALTYQGVFDHPDLNPEPTRGHLLSINIDFNDPNLGEVRPVVALDQNSVAHIGGLLYSANSGLNAYGTSDEGPFPNQNTFFSINQFSGEANKLMSYPGTPLSDGCSCPFSFSFTNLTPQEGIFCNNDSKHFVVTIRNDAFKAIENVTLRDTFPEGMIIDNVAGLIPDNMGSVAGLGSNILEISNLKIPGKSTLEIRVKVLAIDAPLGSHYNQAFLYDMPERFGGVVPSDDPWTVGLQGDASLYLIVPRKLENATWEVSLPSDCLLANDGQISVHSPDFLPGQQYAIKMRNKIGWDEFTYEVQIDQQNSFHIDSLLPGEYQIYELRSLTSNCGFAIKDTVIFLDAPHDQLKVDISSNSPVCAGQDLILTSILSPDGNIRWTGPQLYGSEDVISTIQNATTAYSGEFQIKADYGYCEQIDFLDVEVKAFGHLSIQGDTQYCARDTLRLEANGVDTSGQYNWIGPNNTLITDTLLYLINTDENNEGFYSFVSNNGACLDTVTAYVKILPAPIVLLDEEIFSDYCDQIRLEPEIIGEGNIQINWSPANGLDCFDCFTPVIDSFIQSQYKAVVTNDFACTDSASIEVRLDKSKLVYAPNILIVDAQGENGRFQLNPYCVVNRIRKLEIYNRWGNTVYKDSGDSSKALIWDGYINGFEANDGVYVWWAEVELVDGHIELLNGNVSVLK